MTFYFESDPRLEYVPSDEQLAYKFDELIKAKQPIHAVGNRYDCLVAYFGKKDLRLAACHIKAREEDNDAAVRILATHKVKRFPHLPPTPILYLKYIGPNVPPMSLPFHITKKSDLIPDITVDTTPDLVDDTCARLAGYLKGTRVGMPVQNDEAYRKSMDHVLGDCFDRRPITPRDYASLKYKIPHH